MLPDTGKKKDLAGGFRQGYSEFSCLSRNFHCVKSVRIRSFSGPYFPAFGLNTEIYGVNLPIQSECGKIRTRKTPNTDTFYVVYLISVLLCFDNLWGLLVKIFHSRR